MDFPVLPTWRRVRAETLASGMPPAYIDTQTPHSTEPLRRGQLSGDRAQGPFPCPFWRQACSTLRKPVWGDRPAAAISSRPRPWRSAPGFCHRRSSPPRRATASTWAVIGCGNQSTVDLPAFLQQDDVQVVAVCDVNTASHGYRTPEQFLGRKPAQEKVERLLCRRRRPRGDTQGCEAYNDFRDVLAPRRRRRRGDHRSRPLARPDDDRRREGRQGHLLRKAAVADGPPRARRWSGPCGAHRRILQTGSQYRSSPPCRFACELVRNGRIGQLKKVTTLVPENNAVDPGPGWKPMPVPEGFDYDIWLGPAPEAPYHAGPLLLPLPLQSRLLGRADDELRRHMPSTSSSGRMGTDRSGPIEFEDAGGEWPPPGGLYTTATKVHFRARYANGVELECVRREAVLGRALRRDRRLGQLRLRRREVAARVDRDLENRRRGDPPAGGRPGRWARTPART